MRADLREILDMTIRVLFARVASPSRLSRLCRGRPRPCHRVVSLRGVPFSYFCHENCSDLKCLFVRIDTYQSETICEYVRNRVIYS